MIKIITVGNIKEKYLKEFADVDYKMVCGTGHTGTCSGMAEAVSYIPENERFMIIWCTI